MKCTIVKETINHNLTLHNKESRRDELKTLPQANGNDILKGNLGS